MTGQMVAFLPKLRRKMAPAGLLLRAPLRPPVLRTPPLQLHRRLARVRVTAAARRGSTRHWANSTACPARSRTCSRCGRCGHFSRVCRCSGDASAVRPNASTVTNTVTVLQVDENIHAVDLLRLPVCVNGCVLPMLVDTGAAVSLLSVQDYRRCFAHIKLQPSHVILQNYTEQPIQTSGYFKASVSYNGNFAAVTFYVTDKGTSLLGLDAIRDLKIIIVGETLSCTLGESSTSTSASLVPDRLGAQHPGKVDDSVHRGVRREGVPSVSSGFHRRPCRIPQVTRDLLRPHAAGVVKWHKDTWTSDPRGIWAST
ncbi:hypothetical protein MTO96_018570 [Rhipicephalus appendiculatus]